MICFIMSIIKSLYTGYFRTNVCVLSSAFHRLLSAGQFVACRHKHFWAAQTHRHTDAQTQKAGDKNACPRVGSSSVTRWSSTISNNAISRFPLTYADDSLKPLSDEVERMRDFASSCPLSRSKAHDRLLLKKGFHFYSLNCRQRWTSASTNFL